MFFFGCPLFFLFWVSFIFRKLIFALGVLGIFMFFWVSLFGCPLFFFFILIRCPLFCFFILIFVVIAFDIFLINFISWLCWLKHIAQPAIEEFLKISYIGVHIAFR